MDAVGEPWKLVRLQFLNFISFSFFTLFLFSFLEGAVVRLLFPSNSDEAGGGHRFVLLVTLITPWGTSVVPFPSCSVPISLLPADSSVLITVFMLTYVTKSKNTVFLGGNYAKTDKCPVKRTKLLRERCEFDLSHQVLLLWFVWFS